MTVRTIARTSVPLLRISRITLVLRHMDTLAILTIQVSRRRRIRVVPVEKHRHLLQSVSARFRVVEVNYHAHDEKHRYEHKVILPSDRLQGHRVDEGVEEDCRKGRAPSYSQAAGTQAVGPDLAGVGAEERGPEDCSLVSVVPNEWVHSAWV